MIALKTRQCQAMQRHGGALRLKLGRSPISHGYLSLEASSPILRCVVGPAQIRRVEKLPLQLATDLMHGRRADDVALGEHARPRTKWNRAQVDRQRRAAAITASSSESERRMGGMGNCLVGLRAKGRRARVRRSPIRLVRSRPNASGAGGIFSDRRLRRPRSVKLADGPAPARSLRRPLLDERARNVRPLVVRVHCW